MAKKLEGIWPVNVTDSSRQAMRSVPSPSSLGNIPFLRNILETIVKDWVDDCGVYAKLWGKDREHMLDIIDEIKPRFIQRLFSYITFFFMVENGYYLVYSQLNSLNNDLALKIKHGKPPKKAELIYRLRRVRNWSIAHWSDTEKRHEKNAIAGRMLGVNWKKDDPLTELQFGSASVLGAKDRNLPSIPKIHQQCVSYLDEFDEVCASYLLTLKLSLPIRIGHLQYTNPKKDIKFRVLGNPINGK